LAIFNLPHTFILLVRKGGLREGANNKYCRSVLLIRKTARTLIITLVRKFFK